MAKTEVSSAKVTCLSVVSEWMSATLWVGESTEMQLQCISGEL